MGYLPDTSDMTYTVYIYAPEQGESMKDFRCPRCSRIVFRSNSNRIFITNRYGANIRDLPPSSNYIEHRCHSCHAHFNILFQ